MFSFRAREQWSDIRNRQRNTPSNPSADFVRIRYVQAKLPQEIVKCRGSPFNKSAFRTPCGSHTVIRTSRRKSTNHIPWPRTIRSLSTEMKQKISRLDGMETGLLPQRSNLDIFMWWYMTVKETSISRDHCFWWVVTSTSKKYYSA